MCRSGPHRLTRPGRVYNSCIVPKDLKSYWLEIKNHNFKLDYLLGTNINLWNFIVHSAYCDFKIKTDVSVHANAGAASDI